MSALVLILCGLALAMGGAALIISVWTGKMMKEAEATLAELEPWLRDQMKGTDEWGPYGDEVDLLEEEWEAEDLGI